MSICVSVLEIFNDEAKKRGEFEFEHLPVEIPRNIATEDINPTTTIYIDFVSRYSGE